MLTTRIFAIADDFGICPERDDGIVRGVRAGVISAASLMVNWDTGQLETAVGKARDAGLPLGLHLNLTEGPPVSPGASLCGEDGCMLGKMGFRAALHAGSIDVDELAAEIEDQFVTFELFVGRPPRYVDGHQHVHVLPTVDALLFAAMRRHGVRRVRIADENVAELPWMDEDAPRTRFLAQVRRDSQRAEKLVFGGSARLYDAFIGLGLMGRDLTAERLVSCVSHARNDTERSGTMLNVEYMCHPGHACTSGTGDEFNRSSDRDYELDTLMGDELRAVIETAAIGIVTADRFDACTDCL